jgi:hypothetical protein
MCIISFFCVFATFVDYKDRKYYDNYTLDELNKYRKVFKRFIVLFVVCLLGVIFVPSESTATKMLIASQVNETNVERAKEVIDYVVEKIQEVKR